MACVVVVVGVNKEELVDVESWSAAAEAAMTAHGAARQLFESKWRVDIFLSVLGSYPIPGIPGIITIDILQYDSSMHPTR